MLPPHLPASRKVDRAAPVRARRGKLNANAGLAPARVGLKGPLRVIGSKAEAAKRKKGSRLC